MLKNKNKFTLNFKILRIFIISAILVSTPLLNNFKDVKAGLEFQWDQDSNFRRLKWFQKENKKNLEIQFIFS